MSRDTTSNDLITIGPESEEWIYNPTLKTYDLSRSSPNQLKIATTRGDEVRSILINPEISALVVIDMQNFFLHPKCRDHPLGLATVEPTIKVIEKCRQLGIQVSRVLKG
jgi:isochorismate hydrolase